MMVLCLKRFGGKNALGANLVLFSQNGNKISVKTPIVIMAIILAFFHLPSAFGAKVSGKRINEIAVARRSSPKKSKSYHKLFNTSGNV